MPGSIWQITKCTNCLMYKYIHTYIYICVYIKIWASINKIWSLCQWSLKCLVKGKVLDASSNFASCHSEMSGFSGLGGVSTAQLGGTVSGSINFPWQPCMTSLTFTQPILLDLQQVTILNTYFVITGKCLLLIRCLTPLKYWYMLHMCSCFHFQPVTGFRSTACSLFLPVWRECHLHFSCSQVSCVMCSTFWKHSPWTWSCAHTLLLQVYICPSFHF